jgi:hypothetical protein
MKTYKVISYLLSVSLLAACGNYKEPENNDEDFNDAISAMSALGSAAAGAMEADEAMSEKDKETSEKIEKNLVHFKQLRAALPDEIEGYEKIDEGGESIKMGAFSISQAFKTYKKGDKKLNIEVLDYALASVMLNSLKVAGNIEMEDDEKYHKSIKLDENTFGWEEYHFNSNKSNVVLILNNRLMLNVEVRNAEPGEALEIAKSIDLDELKALTES